MRTRLAALLPATALLALASPLLAQTTRHVPGSYATIQAAIDASGDGDTVLVAPGIYLESINFLGKDIAVQGSGATQTIIDGHAASTVVRFVNGESSAAVLSQFTIRNGLGAPSFPGAVLCSSSAPTILDCIFEANVGGPSTALSERGGAGAMACDNSSPDIERCAFIGNLGGDGIHSYARGGAGVLDCESASAPQLRDCLFEGNAGGTGVAASGRGGPGVLGKISNSAVLLEDCILRMNQGGDGMGEGGAGAILATGGCGFQCTPPELVVRNTSLIDNRGGDGRDGGPGAVMASSHLDEPVFSECTFERNTGGAGTKRGGAGALACVFEVAPLLSDCTFRRNVGGDSLGGEGQEHGGPGVAHCASGSPTFIRCNIILNRGGHCLGVSSYSNGGSGAIDAITNAAPRLEACLVLDNVGGRGGEGEFDWGGPGAVLVSASGDPVLLSSVFARNRGGSAGNSAGEFEFEDRSGTGAILVSGSGTVQAVNCTCVLNEAGPATPTEGVPGGMYLRPQSRVHNSIVWGNVGSGPKDEVVSTHDGFGYIARIHHSCLGEPWPAGFSSANIVADPLLADVAADDYHLTCDSPCLDAGNDMAPLLPTEDLDGGTRIFGTHVDIGADEADIADAGQNYCSAATNSSGGSATISAFGSTSLSGSCFRLFADGLPGTPGLFFYGPNQIQVTFGDGFRCVGGAIRRLPPSPSQNGVLSREVDLSTTPISADSTWNFQAWYRDPAAGGAGFNLSDGLEVNFQR